MLPMIHQGSVKDILGETGKSPYVFHYSDRYSLFDWGAMPDQLNDKGHALAFMAWFFFKEMESPQSWQKLRLPNFAKQSEVYRKLTAKGLAHHLLGKCDQDGRNIESSGEWSPFLKVRSVQVLRPPFVEGEYNYKKYSTRPRNALLPLEIIFRFGVPQGSSLLSRTNDMNYCRSLGLKKAPVEGERFERPVLEFSTKLEKSDRYLSEASAQKLACLQEGELQRLKETTTLVALHLQQLFNNADIDLWDGKLEFAFAPELRNDSERDFLLVDSIGPDELRLYYKGISLSKENLRQFYKNSSWHSATKKAKEKARSFGDEDWKAICINEFKSSPSPLDKETKEAAEMMYKALANTMAQSTGRALVFPDAWTLEQVAASFRSKD